MLNLFRKYAAGIALTIVVFFVGTMFTGAVLFGQYDPEELSPTRNIDEANVVAYNNYIDLPLDVYNEMLQRLASQIPESVLRFNPELIEQLSISAFQRAVEYEQLYLVAQQKKIKASNSQFKAQLPGYLKAFQVETVGDLKSALRERGVSYKSFKERAKKNIQIQSVYQQLQNEVAATAIDLIHVKTQIQAAQIELLLTPKEEEDPKDAQKRQEELAQVLYLRLQNGETLDAVVASLDKQSHVKLKTLGMVSWGELPLPVEAIAFDLGVGEVSAPITLADRLVIIKVTDKKPVENFVSENDEALKKQLTQSKQLRHIQESLDVYGKWTEFTILDKRLAPIISKGQGNITDALNGYKGLISQSPSNPVPYYLLGNLQLSLGMKTAAQDNWEKGVILADANDAIQLPILYLKLGDLYRSQGKWGQMKKQFDQAIETVSDDLPLAEHTSSYLKSIKAPSYAKRVDDRIAVLKKEKAEQDRRLDAAKKEGLLDSGDVETLKLQLN